MMSIMHEINPKMIANRYSNERRQNISAFLNENDSALDGYMPKIGVIGCGGAGGNAINLLQTRLSGQVEFFVCNTDVQALKSSTCENKIVLGLKITKGKGAGAKPAVGRAAAEDTIDEIIDEFKRKQIDMLLIVGGEGGGTGTGAMPVVAKAAREEGILTIGVVTKPFAFEGSHRMAAAEQGIRELQDEVDTLIVSANDNLRSVTNGAVSFKKAFEISDTFLAECVTSFVSIIQETGLVNVDFADLCSVAKDRKSRAIMGTGYAEGENAGTRAIEEAMSSLLLDFGDVKWESVCNVVVCIHGGEDLQMTDVNDINEIVKNKISPNANIIMGATIRQEMKNAVRVFVFGTTNKTAAPAQSDTKKRKRDEQKISLEYSDSESIYVGTRHALHEDVDGYEAGSSNEEKPGFFGRLFGKKPQVQEKPEIKRVLPPFLRDDSDSDDDDDE